MNARPAPASTPGDTVTPPPHGARKPTTPMLPVTCQLDHPARSWESGVLTANPYTDHPQDPLSTGPPGQQDHSRLSPDLRVIVSVRVLVVLSREAQGSMRSLSR